MRLEDLDEILRGSPEQNRRIREIIECAQTWREAVCDNQPDPGDSYNDMQNFDELGFCNGENHVEECPVEVARSELLAALNAFDFHH